MKMKIIRLRNWSIGISCTLLFATLFNNDLLEWRMIKITGTMLLGIVLVSTVLTDSLMNPIRHYTDSGNFGPGPWLIESVIPTLDCVVFEIPGINEPQILQTGTSSEKRFVIVMKYAKSPSFHPIRHTTVLNQPLEVGSYYIVDSKAITKICPGQLQEWV